VEWWGLGRDKRWGTGVEMFASCWMRAGGGQRGLLLRGVEKHEVERGCAGEAGEHHARPQFGARCTS